MKMFAGGGQLYGGGSGLRRLMALRLAGHVRLGQTQAGLRIRILIIGLTCWIRIQALKYHSKFQCCGFGIRIMLDPDLGVEISL
jgi:hypothetical protein